MEYLPITVKLKDKPCLIVGGGDIAARKLKTLLNAGAKVEMVSLSFNDDVKQVISKFGRANALLTIMDIGNRNEFEKLILEEFMLEESLDVFTSNLDVNDSVSEVTVSNVAVSKYSLIITATDQPLINRMVSVTAKKLNIPVNVVDNLDLSTFILPAIIDRSPLLIAVSTVGVSPLLARKIRERIEWILPQNLGSIFVALKKIRKSLKLENLSFRSKKKYLEKYIDARLNNEDQYLANQFFQLNNTSDKLKGKVYLVGAGPGDPDLLTVKALKLLQKADIVFYDSLVSEDIIELVRRDAKLIHVGKRAKCHSASQEEINKLLVASVTKYDTVIRLKGGDPFIFGRGGEELEMLEKSAIQFEVVPGITAASGCASYAGIPLTHRDYSQSLHLVTAHEKNANTSIDWKGLANKNQTLVFYMGLINNKMLSKQLIKNGLSPSTPIAIIENGTRKEQRTITGRINQLTSIVEDNVITTPAIIIVGDVVTLQKKLSWFKENNINIDNRQCSSM